MSISITRIAVRAGKGIKAVPFGFKEVFRYASTSENGTQKSQDEKQVTKNAGASYVKEQQRSDQPKSTAQLDEEMRKAMEGLAGDGGESGAELEDGKPVAMKRGVRENMFRVI